jgi:hypothetical protein
LALALIRHSNSAISHCTRSRVLPFTAPHETPLDRISLSNISENLIFFNLRGVDEAAAEMLAVIDALTAEESGGFFDYRGERLPW